MNAPSPKQLKKAMQLAAAMQKVILTALRELDHGITDPDIDSEARFVAMMAALAEVLTSAAVHAEVPLDRIVLGVRMSYLRNAENEAKEAAQEVAKQLRALEGEIDEGINSEPADVSEDVKAAVEQLISDIQKKGPKK